MTHIRGPALFCPLRSAQVFSMFRVLPVIHLECGCEHIAKAEWFEALLWLRCLFCSWLFVLSCLSSYPYCCLQMIFCPIHFIIILLVLPHGSSCFKIFDPHVRMSLQFSISHSPSSIWFCFLFLFRFVFPKVVHFEIEKGNPQSLSNWATLT